MIKKTLSIFFILLANFVLLVHAVIPHHYHQDEVCLASAQCQTDHNQQTDAAHDHHHDSKNTGAACVLSQIVVIADAQENQEVKCFVNTELPLQISGELVALVNGNQNLKQLCFDLLTVPIPLLGNSYQFYAVNSLGLRAPPTA